MKKAPEPIVDDHPPEWHREKFAEFTAAKATLGEPSPHMSMVIAMSESEDWWERVWRAGCYAVPYSVLSAEAIWTAWPWARMRREPALLLPWLKEHWAGIHIRTERRCVRTPEKFARSLESYGDWAALALPHLLQNEATYDQLWESANRSVYQFGRYIIIRVLELYRRSGFTKAELYDIRSIGGWSPVRALTLFYPDKTDELLGGNIRAADELAMQLFYELKANGLALNPYVYAAMLCEYREALEDSNQFPGHTIDQELGYANRFGPWWEERGFKTSLWEVRSKLFPRE